MANPLRTSGDDELFRYTLQAPAIDKVMKLVSARLQRKVWNADPDETRRTYTERADSACHSACVSSF